jgi:hypothetical protein
MYYEYEEYYCGDHEYDQKKELEPDNRNKRQKARYQKWNHEEDDRYYEGTQIEEYHGKVEPSSYCDISHSEPG